MTIDPRTSPVHALQRQCDQARALLENLKTFGITPTKAVTDATSAGKALTALQRKLATERDALSTTITDAGVRADEEFLVAAITRRRDLAEAVESLNSELTVHQIVNAETAAIYGLANDRRGDIISTFNTAADEFLTIYRSHFGGAQISAARILGTPEARHWPAFLGHAEVMNVSARILDTLDSVEGEDRNKATRYGRHLAYPGAADRTYRFGGPSMGLAPDANGYVHFPSGWDRNRQYRNGFEWLSATELEPLRRWLLIATADAIPGERAHIAYDPDAEAADDAAHAELSAAWVRLNGAGHMHISTFAEDWWSKRLAGQN